MNNFVLKKDKSLRAFVLATSIYGGASVFGPIVVIGGAGFFLDLYFKTKPVMTFVALLVSFIITNILLFKKAIEISNYVNKQGKVEDESVKKQ